MTVIIKIGRTASSSWSSSQEGQEPRGSMQWLWNFVRAVDRIEMVQPLDSTVQDFKTLIESRPDLRMLASAMFHEVPTKYLGSQDPAREKPVRSYQHMLKLLSIISTQVAPQWGMDTNGLSLIGLPFNAIFDWPMATPSGYAFFLREEVNRKLKAILNAWRDRVLKTTKSQYVITAEEGGWLCQEALAAAERDANGDNQTWNTFQELFMCDPQGDPVHWGFQCWDDFFVRQFRDIDKLRPVEHALQPEYIANACESIPVAIKSNISNYDSFWLKGERYSVAEMLDRHEFADQFVGGTVYQALLGGTSYHRWHSPVSGNVVHARIVNGTYFSQGSPGGPGGPDIPSDHHQVYLSHIATRALIFIKAPDPVGLVCFIAIGMADVSSCEIVDKFCKDWPQPVRKGEEIGMFHFGGSGLCLVFRKGVSLAWVKGAVPDNERRNLAVRRTIAIAYPSPLSRGT